MDITMPNIDGIEATRGIVSQLPHVKVIPLSIHTGKRFVENMLRAGAAGYLLKESAPEELVGAIRSVHQGDVCLSSAISGVVVSEYVRLLSQPNNGDDRGELSEDEGSLLRLIAEGHSVKEIAAALSSNTRSVQSTRKRLISKVGVSNVAELTEYARANQWAEGRAQVKVGASQNAEGAVPTAPILGTKFHRPNVSTDFVSRRRLLEKLDQSCELPLTLISAPAGYGKSSLMADWLASHDERCVAVAKRKR
jgi:LuxR family maltose regulon positive regulatory protein